MNGKYQEKLSKKTREAKKVSGEITLHKKNFKNK